MLGWLSPDGTLYPCETYEHILCADQIIEHLNCPTLGLSSDEVLIKKGWVHITKSEVSGAMYHIHWERALTDYQKNFLKPYFENCDLPIASVARMAWESEY